MFFYEWNLYNYALIKLSVHLPTKCSETKLLQWHKIAQLQESLLTILRMIYNLEIMNGWRLHRYIRLIRLILHFFQMTTKKHLIFPAFYQIHLCATCCTRILMRPNSTCWGLLFRWNNEWESNWSYVKSIPRFVVVWLKIRRNGAINLGCVIRHTGWSHSVMKIIIHTLDKK